MRLIDLPNIGTRLAEDLSQAGISTPSELAAAGSVDALIAVNRAISDEGCLSRLYALEGALQGIRWHQLPSEEKESLKLRYYAALGRKV